MAVQRTKADWEEIISAYRESGQSQTEYCRAHGLSAKTLGANIRKSRVRDGMIKKAPIQRSAEEWARLISEQRVSGMNRTSWCEKHEINPSSMTSAEKRIRARSNGEQELKWMELRSVAEEEKPPVEKGNNSLGIRIRGGDLDIEVSADYPVDKLAELIGKLVKVC